MDDLHAELSQTATSPAGLRAARDLTVQEPRPFGLELEGYTHLPRMLDKARATLAGIAGSYQFGCPVDHTCMARLGIAPELVLDLARRHAGDAEVLQALRDHGIPSAREAWFDAAAVEDELQEAGTYLRVRRRDQLADDGDVRVFAGADHGAGFDVLLVEAPEDHEGGGPAAPAAQVWVIYEGQATLPLLRRAAGADRPRRRGGPHPRRRPVALPEHRHRSASSGGPSGRPLS